MAKFWEIFKKFEEAAPEEAVQEAVRQATGLSSTDRQSLSSSGLRLGMWVSTPEGIGIVTGTYADCAEVMLVDAAGVNKRTQNFTLGSIQQAKHLQIPSARRPDKANSGY